MFLAGTTPRIQLMHSTRQIAGSGEVEGTLWSITQERLKTSRAWWKEDHSDHMPAIRTPQANSDWDRYRGKTKNRHIELWANSLDRTRFHACVKMDQ
jgi:hypothetical protein